MYWCNSQKSALILWLFWISLQYFKNSYSTCKNVLRFKFIKYKHWIENYKKEYEEVDINYISSERIMVGTDGYAPSTFSMSMKHSTIELSPPCPRS